MGFYKYIRDAWKKPKENMTEIYKQKLVEYRKDPETVRLMKPTRLDRARSLGYRAKPGFVVVRQRVSKGGHKRPHPNTKGGRRPKHSGQQLTLHKNYQQICEERVQRKYPNCNVLSSYWVGDDGKSIWYEIVLVDTSHPQILKDKDIKWIAEQQHKGRVFRGLTSAGKRARGTLTNKGMGAEKLRPSRRAHQRRG